MKIGKLYGYGIAIGLLLLLTLVLIVLDYQKTGLIKNDNYRYLLLLSISLWIVHGLIIINTSKYLKEMEWIKLQFQLNDNQKVPKEFRRGDSYIKWSRVLSFAIILICVYMVLVENYSSPTLNEITKNIRHYLGPILDLITVLIFGLFIAGDSSLAKAKQIIIDQLKAEIKNHLGDSEKKALLEQKLNKAYANKEYIESQMALISKPGFFVMVIISGFSILFTFLPHYHSELINPMDNGIFPEGFSYGATVLHLLFTQLIFNYLDYNYQAKINVYKKS